MRFYCVLTISLRKKHQQTKQTQNRQQYKQSQTFLISDVNPLGTEGHEQRHAVELVRQRGVEQGGAVLEVCVWEGRKYI